MATADSFAALGRGVDALIALMPDLNPRTSSSTTRHSHGWAINVEITLTDLLSPDTPLLTAAQREQITTSAPVLLLLDDRLNTHLTRDVLWSVSTYQDGRSRTGTTPTRRDAARHRRQLLSALLPKAISGKIAKDVEREIERIDRLVRPILRRALENTVHGRPPKPTDPPAD
jgi:hypothetical protein